jgi:hypothetical protein
MSKQNIEQIVNILLKYQHRLSDGYEYYTREHTVSEVLVNVAQDILIAINKTEECLYKNDSKLLEKNT